jgi:hypothetical protein
MEGKTIIVHMENRYQLYTVLTMDWCVLCIQCVLIVDSIAYFSNLFIGVRSSSPKSKYRCVCLRSVRFWNTKLQLWLDVSTQQHSMLFEALLALKPHDCSASDLTKT